LIPATGDLAQLIVQHIPRLRRYARALTGDRERADDLVQDSLERAWSRIHLWRGGDMRPWLFTIMHNLFANSARRHSREPVWVPLAEEEAATETPSAQEAALDLSDLHTALQQLPEEQRTVLLLVGLEQLSYEEVATILRIPIGTVMSRLSRGREHLRGFLQGDNACRLRRVK
jgi:RNA polymerase sigma-70 factor (ECF subfamily)